MKDDLTIKAWKVVSTISSGGAMEMLVSTASKDDMVLISAAIVGCAIGATLTYKVIPELIKIDSRRSRKAVFSIGILLSLTYPLNAWSIHNKIVKYKAEEVDPRYTKNIEKYSSYSTFLYKENKKTKSLEETAMKKQAELEEAKIQKRLKDFRSELSLKIGKFKKENSKEKYTEYYTNLAKEHGCRLPIGFTRLVNCTSKSEYNRYASLKSQEIKKATLAANNAKVKWENAKKEDAKNKQKAEESLLKLKNLKAEIKKAKMIAKKEAVSFYAVAAILWLFGIFVEIVIVGWNLLKRIWQEDQLIEEKSSQIKTIKKQLEKATEEYQKVLHNYEGMDLLISYANDKNHELRKKLSWKGGPKKGQIIAISNAIVGAFLYAYTTKKEKGSISSWEEVSQSDILFVNGRAGTEMVNSKKRLRLISTYTCNVSQTEVNCLGSTAEELNIRNYGKAHPQKEALEFLREKEKKLGFSPQNLTKDEIISLIISFTKKYHSTQFDR